ncbi:hypothetical protein [Hymenobacter rigui]|uniref:Lipoprotein n=1 Tax=Hymenobacter rigui TaxID=334424 RepID=A0A428KM21_9BACT|nr:hypothetical protein [Hymenobacter rigui]RSK47415.1 hypothetical protein EI291_16015 [Hymenobacter rigui]
MKKTLLILSAAAAFMTASCSENKTADTATTSADGTTTTTTTTTTTSYTPEAIERRADRIAADMATKMKFDDATRTKVRTIYVTRGQRIAELQNKYASDTMGMAAAMRGVYTDTDAEMKTIFTDPTQYSAYESSRTDYMDDRYMDDNAMSSSDSNMDTTSMSSSSSSDMSTTSSTGTMESGAGVSKMKAKAEDGSKIKIKDNGKVKTKDADGEKTKM